jgi:iron complex transport system substrate-binding protein
MNPRTLADIDEDIRLLGRITGRTGAAETVVQQMRREFAAIGNKTRNRKRLRVYCEAWPNPRISSPPWVAEVVTIAGGKIVVPVGQKITDEQVAEARPDVIVLAWAATGYKADPQKSYEVPSWKHIPAVQKKRVYVVRDELLNTPGPPLVAGAKELFRLFQAVSANRGAGRKRA